MSKYLIKVEETYRADSENEAAQIIDEAKKDSRFVLAKYSSVKKNKKEKGEVVEEWTRVSLTKVFDEEKEPTRQTSVDYAVEDIFELE